MQKKTRIATLFIKILFRYIPIRLKLTNLPIIYIIAILLKHHFIEIVFCCLRTRNFLSWSGVDWDYGATHGVGLPNSWPRPTHGSGWAMAGPDLSSDRSISQWAQAGFGWAIFTHLRRKMIATTHRLHSLGVFYFTKRDKTWLALIWLYIYIIFFKDRINY